MKIHKAYKTELNPTEVQKVLLRKHAGAARFAYNWGLQRNIQHYKVTKKGLSAITLYKEMRALRDSGELSWLWEVSKHTPQEALRNLDAAFSNFFRRFKARKAGQKESLGFPKFKSKHSGRNSFAYGFMPGGLHTYKSHIDLPRIGCVRLKEHSYIPSTRHSTTKFVSATVSESCGRWYISVSVEQSILEPKVVDKTDKLVGIDLGIKTLATLSDGTTFANVKALAKRERKIKHLQREVSRKKKGSNNRKKAIKRLAIAHKRVADARKDSIHKATTAITKRYGVIGIEDLKVEKLLKNKNLAKGIADASFSEFRRQLEYKAKWYGCKIVVADQFFPSSQLCSSCGSKKSMPLHKRRYVCGCGLKLNRDLNAAKNLEKVAADSAEYRAMKAAKNACGGIVSLKVKLKQIPLKQEVSPKSPSAN